MGIFLRVKLLRRRNNAKKERMIINDFAHTSKVLKLFDVSFNRSQRIK
jgi:hypothetical protein